MTSGAAYYNEHDPQAAAWLRALIGGGHITAGEVDERSILDVAPEDLRGYTQCHFFAGIGGWSYALRLAGWPDDRPVWTGSCPCQPFSVAGRQAGVRDSRHLWPDWFRLIRQCRPAIIFGEQVEAAIRHDWLDLVSADLEGEGYAVGAVVLPAASVQAPHVRHRLWFVAESQRGAAESQRRDVGAPPDHIEGEARQRERLRDGAGAGSAVSRGLADDDDDEGCGEQRRARLSGQRDAPHRNDTDRRCSIGELGDDASDRLEVSEYAERRTISERGSDGCDRQDSGWPETHGELGTRSEVRSPWWPADWLPCRDGKYRPVEPGTFPLAHGIPGRVGLLRGYGNAIVPQVAAEVIRAYMDVRYVA